MRTTVSWKNKNTPRQSAHRVYSPKIVPPLAAPGHRKRERAEWSDCLKPKQHFYDQKISKSLTVKMNSQSVTDGWFDRKQPVLMTVFARLLNWSLLLWSSGFGFMMLWSTGLPHWLCLFGGLLTELMVEGGWRASHESIWKGCDQVGSPRSLTSAERHRSCGASRSSTPTAALHASALA